MVKEPEVEAMELARRIGCPYSDRQLVVAWMRGYQAGINEGKRIVHATFADLKKTLRP